MPVIVALIGRTRRRLTIGALLGAIAPVRVLDRADLLLPFGASVGVELVVAELRDRAGRSTVPMLAQLAAGPRAPMVLALSSLTEADAADVIGLAASGATAHLVLSGLDDLAAAVRLGLHGRSDSRAALAVLERIGPLVPASLGGFFLLCAAHASPRLKLERAAALLHLDRRTIERRLRRAGFPLAHRVMGWCAVLRACWRLDVLDERPKQAALRVGFSSPAALANALARYCDCSATTLHGHGGFATMLERFVVELD